MFLFFLFLIQTRLSFLFFCFCSTVTKSLTFAKQEPHPQPQINLLEVQTQWHLRAFTTLCSCHLLLVPKHIHGEKESPLDPLAALGHPSVGCLLWAFTEEESCNACLFVPASLMPHVHSRSVPRQRADCVLFHGKVGHALPGCPLTGACPVPTCGCCACCCCQTLGLHPDIG